MRTEISTFDFASVEKVFDVSLYKDISPKRRSRIIANHLAGIFLEAGDRPIEERINPWYVVITPEGRAIDIVSREEVFNNFGDKTPLGREEKKGAIDFYYNKAATAKEGDFVYWFSPAGGNSTYKEARISVAKVRKLYGLRVLECYGVPSKFLSEEILKLVDSPDDLRKIAFISSEEVFLCQRTRQAIIKGTPKKIKSEALKSALPIAEKMSRDIEDAVSEGDFVRIGAYGERQMMGQGWFVNKVECPGVFNSDLLKQSFGSFGLTTDGLGNFRRIETSRSVDSDEYGPLRFVCPSGHPNTRERGKLKKYCDTCGCDVSCKH